MDETAIIVEIVRMTVICDSVSVGQKIFKGCWRTDPYVCEVDVVRGNTVCPYSQADDRRDP